jgi:hypothetical protein
MNSADDKQRLVEKLNSGVETWNQWRAEYPTETRLNVNGVNLSGANLCGVDLSEADLVEANLTGLRQISSPNKGQSLFISGRIRPDFD